MADNDIYDSKRRYDFFKQNIEDYLEKPKGKRKYQIQNKTNLKYFRKLFDRFEARDISFIRRMRLSRSFLIVLHIIDKDLSAVTREDIDKVMAYFNNQNFSPKTKRDFALDLKFIWKQILPDKDEKGRYDDSIPPYVVRHLNGKVDKSREKMRNDKLTLEEFEKIVMAFSDDVRIQAYLTLMLESLARPQELLYTRIKDVELHDNYAKINISEHGKEGVKFLRCIDSYKYVSEWYNKHPMRKDKDAFFFITLGNKGKYGQMKVETANKLIRKKCQLLGIKKPITNYSLKRNGVTFRRLRGDSDINIQHTAGWSSTRQLKTYDKSTQDESYKVELIKRGIIKPGKGFEQFKPINKKCVFCGFENAIAESVCGNCKRPLDREAIETEIEKKENEIREMVERIVEERLKQRGAM